MRPPDDPWPREGAGRRGCEPWSLDTIMTTLETRRLIIRNFGPDDWQGLQAMIVKYQQSEYARYDHKWPVGTEEIKRIVEWFAADDSYLAVSLKTTGRFIGFIALTPGTEKGGKEYKLGYVFDADYQRRGYALEGCREVLGWAFGPLAAARMVASTAAANRPSCQLLNRLGMRQTGRSTGVFETGPDGEPFRFPALSFAVTRQEWETVRQAMPQTTDTICPEASSS